MAKVDDHFYYIYLGMGILFDYDRYWNVTNWEKDLLITSPGNKLNYTDLESEDYRDMIRYGWKWDEERKGWTYPLV